ncbi:hypothetical protein GCM10009425_47750 [Pseudomonas asuensis]|uniref:Uncharacterized protein n=1 Tax=Pseudomonas asuensis TaxID=1825787 RepID=A0ABQ2H4V3_9PSED|nr:hypothetical protein GCM10009425_47750 [Pseudomonas asuensis]
MQLAVLFQAFDSGDLVTVMADGQRQAGVYRRPVHMQGTGATLTVVATFFGPSQLQTVTQYIEQYGIGWHIDCVGLAIHF